MGSAQATRTLTQVKVASLRREGREPSPEELAAIEAETYEHFERTSHPYYLTSELRDDGMLDPVQTRDALGIALSAVAGAPLARTVGGVLRI
jgi:3-methylcrotonyl-CoA carboxylase beta subunit